MSAINDGGPAYPTESIQYPSGQLQFGSDGMTLRDWFAGQALAGILTLPDIYAHDSDSVVAKTAYNLADAMIKARGET